MCMSVYMNVCVYVFMYVCVCMYVCVYVYVCIYVCMHALYMRIFANASTCVRACMHACAPNSYLPHSLPNLLTHRPNEKRALGWEGLVGGRARG